jgi:hypothetical protein
VVCKSQCFLNLGFSLLAHAVSEELQLTLQPFLNNLDYISPYKLHGLRSKNGGTNNIRGTARTHYAYAASARSHKELVAIRCVARPVVERAKVGTSDVVDHVAPLRKKTCVNITHVMIT